jgi:DNA invertase Pin-like site-specific DNA recombinase
MPTSLRPAAQYVRMSSDRQDQSPKIQKAAIATFAEANGFEIVCTYEDDARSGMRIQNRPALRKLIRDVVDGTPFHDVLVYDVSRWGRFQDVDASAYYEYHCRLHGVQITYVAETFGGDNSPVTALLKSMRRAAAADYCRDLAVKARAGQHCTISMGFQMGTLPALGFRRRSVSKDGKSRVLLEHGQRKLAATDRVEWVLAPEPEVSLVRRICEAYARTNLELWQIASLVAAEGWRTVRDKPVKENNVASLIRNEALIGNFVWGVSQQNWSRRIVAMPPSRNDGSVPRIIDDETWRLMQHRLLNSEGRGAVQTKASVRRQPQGASIVFGGVVIKPTTERQRSRAVQTRMSSRIRQLHEFGKCLAKALRTEGVSATFDAGRCVLLLWATRIRVKLLWYSAEEWGEYKESAKTFGDYLIIVRMEANYRPLDFFLVPPRTLENRIGRKLSDPLPPLVERFRYTTPTAFVRALDSLRHADSLS